MNVVDLALVGVLLLGGLGGFFRGFVHSILAIAAWVGAVLVTLYGFPHAAPIARSFIELRIAADIAAGAALFVASLVVLSVVRHRIATGVRHSALSALDRSLGFLFGLVFGAALICLLYFAAAWAAGPTEEWPDWAREAKGLPVVERATRAACTLGPPGIRDLCEDVMGARRNASPEDFERWIAPQVRPAPGDSQPGYSDRERRGIDRIFEQNR